MINRYIKIIFILIIITLSIFSFFKSNDYITFKYEYKLNEGHLFRNKNKVIFLKNNELIDYQLFSDINIKFNESNENEIIEIKY